MRITEVTVAAQDPVRLAARWAERLELALVAPDAVAVGETTVRLRAADRPAPAHLAFDVPFAAFDAVLAWARERVELLPTPDGTGHEFDFTAPPWRARSAYFLDDEGNVLELIARRDAPGGHGRLRRVSEVGLPVADVPAAVGALERALGLPLFDGGGPHFAAVGGHDGLLIVVTVGRRWVPTRLTAGDDPVEVALAGPREATLALPGGGHRLSAAGSRAGPG